MINKHRHFPLTPSLLLFLFFCTIQSNTLSSPLPKLIINKTLSESTTPSYFVIQGYVRYEDSKQPVPNTKVQTDYEKVSAITDSDGYFQLNCNPKYTTHSISLVDDNLYSPYLRIDATSQSTANIVLEVKPGGKIKGKVMNQLKEPIKDAESFCFNSEPGQSIIYGSNQVYTDSNGEFSIKKLDMDVPSYRVTIGAKGYNQQDTTNIHFTPGQNEIKLTITLSSTEDKTEKGTVSGIVTDELNGPIEGAKVGGSDAIATHIISNLYCTTSTNSQGLFSMVNVPLKNFVVVANAKSYIPALSIITSSEDTVLHLTLKPGHYVGGKIVNTDNKPIGYAQIRPHLIYPDTPKIENNFMEVWYLFRDIVKDIYQSDTTGQFRIEGLAGKNVKLDFMDYGYTSIQDTTLDLDRDDYVITLLSSGQISGFVLDDETNKPLSPFHLAVNKSIKNPQRERVYGGVSPFDNQGQWVYKDDGTFTIPRLESDLNYKVSATAEGYRQEDIDPVKPTTDTTGKSKKLEIRLIKIKPTDGSVVDNQSGKGIQNVIVTAFQPHDEQYRSYNWDEDIKGSITTTDVNGYFRFPDLSYSHGLLAFAKQGYGKTLLSNVDYTRYIDARLPKAASITVIYMKPTDTSHDTAQIYLLKQPDPYLIYFGMKSPDIEGKFKCTDLPPGNYSVEIQKNPKDNNLIYHQVSLLEGQNLVLDLTGPPPVKIFGKVTWKGTSAFPAHIFAYNLDSSFFNANAEIDKNGNYEIIFYEAGNYRFNFYKNFPEPNPKHIFTYRSLSVTSGEYRLDCNLPDSVIQGLILDTKSGKPIPSTPVTAYQKKKEYDNYAISLPPHCDYTTSVWTPFMTVTTNQNGQFLFDPVDSGEWMVAMEKGLGLLFPGKSFPLKSNTIKNDIVLRTPETGSLNLSVLDEDSGNRLLPTEITCADSTGYIFPFPPDTDSTGKLIYPTLPVGNYRISALTDDHPTGFLDIEILPGKTVDTTIKFQQGGRLVLNILGKNKIPDKSKILLICKIQQAKNGVPVLEDSFGGYRRYVFTITLQSKDTNYLPLPPGEYTVEIQTKKAYEKGMFSILVSRQTKLLKIERGKDINWEINLNSLK